MRENDLKTVEMFFLNADTAQSKTAFLQNSNHQMVRYIISYPLASH